MSPEVRFFIVSSNLYYFFVHQPSAMNSIPDSPLTPHTHSTSSQIHTCSPVESLWWSLFVGTVNILRLLAVFAEELCC